MSNGYCCTYRHTLISRTFEDSCETPRAMKAKKKWRKTSLLWGCISKRWPDMTWTTGLYVFYQRLTQKLSSKFSQSVCVCACAQWPCVCMHAFIWVSCTSPSSTATQLHQQSPFNAPSHISVCVRDAEKWGPRMFQLWTNAEMRRSPEKPEREEKNRRDGEGEERDSYKESLRGQTSEKVEWDIWKRESHWDQEEIAAAQQWFIGENSPLHLPLVLQPLYLTLSPLHTHYSPLEMIDHSNFACPEHLQRPSERFTLIDTLILMHAPFSLSSDLSMNNISEIQSGAFQRLHLLSELWVKSFNLDKSASASRTHDKKQLFRELLMSSVMRIDGCGLLLIYLTRKQPAVITSR